MNNRQLTIERFIDSTITNQQLPIINYQYHSVHSVFNLCVLCGLFFYHFALFLFDFAHLKYFLTNMYKTCILIHMKTTLNIDKDLLAQASRLTGITEKTSLVRRGLEALISLESAQRLAKLGGSEKQLKPVRRRRPGNVK